MKKGLQNILLSATAALVLAACNLSTAQNSAVEDTQIGLRNVELKDEANVKNPLITWKGDLPGSNEVFERSYENAPPLIPHSLDGLLPITLESNACLTCHTIEVAKEMGTIPAPQSHYMYLSTGKKTKEINTERFNCVQCHVPQANAEPLVKNNFKADFRNTESNRTSNLVDVLNQGIK
ncbi:MULTISPECIES: nitrate reductase cytochrome c-type subunit [Campylobacter]|uniref:Periplasmic nitrate reductase, electron transfer subunit n=1 Tax=Campylobacter porcelli TaxID=1660073 RepID=A0ABU7M2N8_9BACT|nr:MULTISPECIES: nitrate reductase cytochrome c-type subunit [unclassified Campylobacter]MCR8678315.1 nitrate reductase cytochrome c-type subunit [Campylobacter sp. RM19072]MCR8695666.1 nitrate reductase cytochrome c-type subunit [Campylobacter sp. RM19073]MEE3704332.1 nitrate reductase cytochrome c-type subunit [Campylobacter sp. CX2-8023-23]MEE3743979.1 nitrate reductase cytochrome c-type subunit [Campylobacter sp. CX2-4855-23]MEE3776237.1 nitrate reductase cytochrome c-type subunit [Campylo